MIDDRDVRDAFARMVAAGPPPPTSAAALNAGRRARRRRTLLTTGTAAGGVAAVLMAGAAFGGLIGGGGGTPASTSAATPAPSPTAAPAPVVPGVSPAEARAIAARCLALVKDKWWTPAARARLQLFNVGATPWGTRYIFYGPTEYLDCLHATEGDYRPDFSTGTSTGWLAGPLTVDRAIADGAPYDRGPGTFTVEGRVVPSVIKVEITYGRSRLTVPVLNGTFMAAMKITAQEVLHGTPSFRALDASGRVVHASTPDDPAHRKPPGCWVTPDGTVVPDGRQPWPGQTCLPAVRWR
ncbi:MAG TPA: hypothetical protein VI357_01065 [Mycobacteriales bacterium]